MARGYSGNWRLGGTDGYGPDRGHKPGLLADLSAKDVLAWIGSICTSVACIILSILLVLWLLPGCSQQGNLGITATREAGPRLEGMFAGEPDIRVRVLAGAAKVEIAGPSRVVVRQAGASTIKPVLMQAPVTLVSNTGGIAATDALGKTAAFGYGNNVEVLASDGSLDGQREDPASSLVIGRTRYPGFALVRPRWQDNPTSVDVIVSMGVESYLPGVLTHELFKDWPRQTYEAQAVAARTYALHERARARAEQRGHDVESTEADQVYGGATGSVVAQEAVRTTRGKVISENGRLVRSYFSSCCGGRPASASVTWPMKPGFEFNAAACLQGKAREHACGKSRFYRWTVTRSDSDVSRRVRAWAAKYDHRAKDMTRLREISVKERNDAQRPSLFGLTDDTGRTYVMTGEELRSACNHAVPEMGPVTEATRVHSSDAEVEVWANQVKFHGRGWGHGVGMCQWCAKGFADLGWDWSRMLKEFYPGAVVAEAY